MTNHSNHGQAMTSNTSTQKQASKKHIRHLDHLADLTTGKCGFTMIPDRLMRAYLDKTIPEPKFKMLCSILTHSSSFHIKQAYLRKRISPTSIKNYEKELIAEGYIRVEKIPSKRGGFEKVYHTNPLSQWAIYNDIDWDSDDNSQVGDPITGNGSQIDDCSPMNSSPMNSSPMNSSPMNSSPVNTLNKTKVNQTKSNKTNTRLSTPPVDNSESQNDTSNNRTQAKPGLNNKRVSKRSIKGDLQRLIHYCPNDAADAFINQAFKNNVLGSQLKRLLSEQIKAGKQYKKLDVILSQALIQRAKMLAA